MTNTSFKQMSNLRNLSWRLVINKKKKSKLNDTNGFYLDSNIFIVEFKYKK